MPSSALASSTAAPLPRRKPARAAKPAARPAKVMPMPSLENGERMMAPEFMRRYEALTGLRKAQLIEGIVHMPSPVRADVHGGPDGLIHGWLFCYALDHPELRMLPNTTLLLDAENAPQPDAMLCSIPRPGGRTWLNDDGYLCGKPELVVEIAASTGSVDLHDKLRAYRRNGIQEYLVWLPTQERLLWHRLTDVGYEEMRETHGKLRSEVFPGLVLDVKAALKLDAAKVIAGLRGKK